MILGEMQLSGCTSGVVTVCTVPVAGDGEGRRGVSAMVSGVGGEANKHETSYTIQQYLIS